MIPSQRHRFDIPDDVCYLNCAYLSPLMHEVVEAGIGGIRRKARPWTIAPRDFYEPPDRLRALFARLINAEPADVALVPAASYGLAVAARNLPLRAGQRVLVLAEQFPSNVYAWRERAARTGAEVLTVRRGPDGDWTRAVLDALDERTAIAALPQCHWTDGSMVDLVAVGARCREVGAALVLDLTQSAGAHPFDVAAVRPDFVAAASYKWLLGPYNLGFLYVAPRWQAGEPIEHSWIGREGSEDFARLVDYRDELVRGAERFDGGERASFHLVPMATAALERILDWGVESIAETLAARTADIAARARALRLESEAPPRRAGHFLGLRFPAGLPEGLAERLAARRIHVSVRGDSMRITPHLYNDERDVDRLLAALAAAL